ncbi:HAD family hydrolase [Bordetella sp. 15P40C-2]|uniref:HAD family hydrolase n=1 Tax=Bordetella sp. 15P40C-2 TaxID=2572246 RepID=UPI0013294F79|nr:HAD hydrolase-like protein [Bordetella sp. 15P40C-2]MVW71164.1 HAD hydrolase-like protein [Bordetella sp. 15P40C-2]
MNTLENFSTPVVGDDAGCDHARADLTTDKVEQRALHALFRQADVRGLIFDLDGTLIDSADDIVGSMRDMLRETGYGEVPQDYFPENLHGTSDGIIRDVMRDMGWAAPDDLTELKATYYRIYAERGHANTRLYPHAWEILRQCSEHFSLGVCTNKIYRNAVSVTDTLGIRQHFAAITGADSWAAAKPSPVPLLETIRTLNLRPEECLYFGDTSVDAECAARAGVRFVLHESGYGDPALHKQPCHHAFKQWKELLTV